MGILEFRHYLFQRPSIVSNEKQLLAVLNDAMCNEKKKYQFLCKAYKAGILDALKASNPPSSDDQQRIIQDLQTNYGLIEATAKSTVDFWVQSFDGFSFEGIDPLKAFMALPKTIGNGEVLPGPRLIAISHNPLRKEVQLQWNRQQTAESYEVWRSIGQEPAILVKSGTFPLPRFSDKEIVSGEVYTYVVRSKAKNSDAFSEFSNMLQIATPFSGSTFEISEVRIVNDAVQLRWTYQTDAEQYCLKRKDLIANDGESVFTIPNSQFLYVDKANAAEAQLCYALECKRRNHTPLVTQEIVLTV